MPGLDGYNAAKAIRSHGLSPQILPIIALTANAFPEDVERALASGMQAHLAKPLMMADLQTMLERWLPRNDPQIQPDRNVGIGTVAPDLLLRWQMRRKEALEAVSAMLRSGSLECREPDELARIVHKMAGTAAMFGEAELGKRAGELEHALRQRSDPEEIHQLAKQLMAAA